MRRALLLIGVSKSPLSYPDHLLAENTMTSIIQTVLRGAVLSLLLSGVMRPVMAVAGDQPNVLVVGEDADEDTVPTPASEAEV